MSKKKKNKDKMKVTSYKKATPKTCLECAKCLYIGEGDSVCEDDYELILDDWTPTDNFCKCEGKRFVPQ